MLNQVEIYGGFLGNETAVDQRDPKVVITTLSGEINGPGPSDNSFVVVQANGVGSTGILGWLHGHRG